MRWRRVAKGTARWASTVAVVTIVAAWVGSRWYTVSVRQRHTVILSDGIPETRTERVLHMAYGTVILAAVRPDLPIGGEYRFETSMTKVESPDWDWSFNRFSDRTASLCRIPLWAPFLLAAVPAVLLWRSDLLARRRRLSGSCVACGYDRRGLAATAPCPECGVAPAPTPSATT